MNLEEQLKAAAGKYADEKSESESRRRGGPMGLGYGDSFKEAYLLGAAKAQELLGESVGLIDALHECESDRILLKKELATEREMSRKLAEALDKISGMNSGDAACDAADIADEMVAEYRAAREGK